MHLMQFMVFMSIMQLMHGSSFVRIKKDGEPKEILLFSTGYLLMIDKVFWNLPFTSPKQAEEVRVKFSIPDTDWDQKWKMISAEHDEPGAREQLRTGWKAWIVEHAGANADAQAAAAPVEDGEECFLDD
jgi:hypothetical protein